MPEIRINSHREATPTLRFWENLVGYREGLPLDRLIFNGILFFSLLASILITAATFIFERMLQSQLLGIGGTILVAGLLIYSRSARQNRWLPLAFVTLVLGIGFYDFLFVAGFFGLILPLFIALSGVVPTIMPVGKARFALGGMAGIPLVIACLLMGIPDQIETDGVARGYLFYKLIEASLLGIALAGSTTILIRYYRVERTKGLALNSRLEDQNRELRNKNVELQRAMEEIQTLRGIIPICAFCKRVRNDDGFFEQVEDYLAERTTADFSHTFCPDCAREHYPEFVKELEERGETLGDINS